MELFIIDGRKVSQARNNTCLLNVLRENKSDLYRYNDNSRTSRAALKFRKKSIATIVYLKIMNRRRMLELLGLYTLSLN